MAIQSIERAAAILRALAGGSKRLGVSELSDRLGLAKGTVHGLLRALQAEGFVEQDPDSGKYQLGGSLLQLGNIYLDVNELRGRSLAWADNLAIRSGEAVRVGTWHGDGVLVIHHVFRPDNTLQILEVGSHLPPHATALGKVLLALRDDSHGDLPHDLPQLTREDDHPAGRARACARTGARQQLGVRARGGRDRRGLDRGPDRRPTGRGRRGDRRGRRRGADLR